MVRTVLWTRDGPMASYLRSTTVVRDVRPGKRTGDRA
jgi:hypothetical protein